MAEMASSSSAPAPAPAPAPASASASASESKKSQGRRKVDMVKMTNESNLQVTFSKRRNGLFKKASELCTLCGVDVAIIVFSPGKKVFSFGHPCVESVVHRYITGIPPPASGSIDLVEAYQNSAIRDLNMQLTQVLSQLDMEKKRSEELNRIRKAAQAECWWEKPVDELELPQLEQLKAALEQLKNNVSNQAERLFFQSLNTHPPMQPQFFAGSSSNAAAADPSGGMSNLPIGSSWNTGDPQAVLNPEMMLPPPPPLLPPPPPQPQPRPGFQNPPFGQGFY